MGQGYLWSKTIPLDEFEELAIPIQVAAKSLGQAIKT